MVDEQRKIVPAGKLATQDQTQHFPFESPDLGSGKLNFRIKPPYRRGIGVRRQHVRSVLNRFKKRIKVIRFIDQPGIFASETQSEKKRVLFHNAGPKANFIKRSLHKRIGHTTGLLSFGGWFISPYARNRLLVIRPLKDAKTGMRQLQIRR
jgi:hypothetical protein